MSRKGHYLSAMPLFYGARYIYCMEPGCGYVKRNDVMRVPMLPLIHKGRRYRR